MVLVIAPSYKEAQEWAHDEGLPSNGWLYLEDHHHLMGRRDAKLKVLGAMRLSPDKIRLVLDARKYLGDGSAYRG